MNIIKPTCVLVLCMLTLLACEKKEPEEKKETVESKSVLDAGLPKDVGTESVKSISIKVEEAGQRISDLLGHSTLERMAKRLP